MKVAIIQFDTRPVEQLGEMAFLLHRNSAWAERHGYAYHYVPAAQFDLPVYWQKPKLCQLALERGYDVAVWLDTDAVVHDVERRIEDLFTGPEVMVAAGDNPHWGQPFNAGVFAVRGPDGARLMARWMDLFEGTAWTRTETAWVCKGEWAGADYEQGAFTRHLLDQAVAAGELRLLDWWTLQSPFPMPDSFTVHFPGPFRMNLTPYLRLI